jgi:hypothetical protein
MFDIPPTSYMYFFPPEIDVTRIKVLIDAKVFPTISKLAPAITYAIVLSIARYILHHVFFKVTS